MKGRESLKPTPENDLRRNGCAVLERLPEPARTCPPRLCREDLDRPEVFHRRLVDWLMQQR